jgi:hypothetical protein
MHILLEWDLLVKIVLLRCWVMAEIEAPELTTMISSDREMVTLSTYGSPGKIVLLRLSRTREMRLMMILKYL